ncbi:MAG TPA: COX15/CtaA family protein [Polyangiaceae bacterium]|nr:COX15/CtaA family protein [Polyangiaceae bacterium]
MAVSRSRALGAWLLVVAGCVFAMVVVGGLTRLTRSGLSIVEWKPLTGVLPPLSAAAWAEEYAKYKASPEGRLVNAGMPLDAFQRIFYVEWAHRLLGRVTGLVVLVPLAWLLAKRKLDRRRALTILGIFSLGGLQGLAGWLMVKSGLADAPHVSPYRLTLHLCLALTCFALLVWTALAELVPLDAPPAPLAAHARRARALAWTARLALGLVGVTVVWGGLMAGTHAGLVAPTFPTMNGAWVPAELAPASLGPARSAVADALTIHFVHRALAYLTTLAVAACAGLAFSRPAPRAARVVVGGMLLQVALQVTLGALTVLGRVPIGWASLHQANATLLLGWCVALVYVARPAPAAAPVEERAEEPLTTATAA